MKDGKYLLKTSSCNVPTNVHGNDNKFKSVNPLENHENYYKQYGLGYVK